MVGKKLALIILGTASGILGGANAACSDNTSCLRCSDDTTCLWCQSNTDYLTGTCITAADGTCDTTTHFPVTEDTNADSCPFQSGGCSTCVANGGSWGYSSTTGKCYSSATACAAGIGTDDTCTDDATTCPTDASGDSSSTNEPVTPAPTTPGDDADDDDDATVDECSQFTFCLTCPEADCVWCQSNTDYFTGNCIANAGTCDASKQFKVTSTSNSDSCPFQSEKCSDCVANGGVWGVYTVDAVEVGRCFDGEATCTAFADEISCTATCPDDNNSANSKFGPNTPAPPNAASATLGVAALFTSAAATAAALALL